VSTVENRAVKASPPRLCVCGAGNTGAAIAAFPGNRIDEVYEILSAIYP
jgi:hypothetical protein